MADAIAEFEEVCKNASLMQEELLASILLKNAGCQYLQKFGSSSSRPLTVSEFKSRVPVVSYEAIASEIERIANGDQGPVLCSEPILRFFTSSGTSSGKRKFIPVTAGYVETAVNAHSPGQAYGSRYIPGDGKTLGFFYCIPEFTTKSGLPVGAASTYYLKSFRALAAGFTTPYEVLLADSDWREQTYCHLLCALLQRNSVQTIQSIYAYTICEAFRMFTSDWQEICSDIETGSLSKKITNQNLREALESSELFRSEGGDAEAAESIGRICSRESREGILPLLFPNLKVVIAVVTGAMKHYVPVLKSYAGHIPIVSGGYVSSEGVLGINIDPLSPPERVVYTVVPTSVYYEFIPVNSTQTPLGVDEVVAGQQYEIVVTNSSGLYRFKVGDVLSVAGFFHGAPQMSFSYRKSAVLNVRNEMVDEQELQNVVSEVAQEFGIEVVNYTSYGDASSSPPHYVVFWELGKSANAGSELLQECCSSIDRSFNTGYLRNRLDKLIGSLKLVIVSQGTFQKMADDAVENGTSPSQYKTPRCVVTSKSLETLYSKRIEAYTSGEVSKSLLEISFPGRNST